jgi:phosphohistidine swiveling domain-containing protein
MSDVLSFDQITSDQRNTVGGKALGLARLANTGLPVPPGFCVTTAAYRRLQGRSLDEDPGLIERISRAYRHLGAGLVAVRSSATTEDGAVTSFAGQQETSLAVIGEPAMLAAISRCWDSLRSDRAIAYRRRTGTAADPAMAVVVQRLVEAEVAGVLFTRDPLDTGDSRMLVEASWGLGESVVSGRVTPDRFHLDRDSGAVVERQIHTKPILRTVRGTEDVPPAQQAQACLDDIRLAELAALGRRAETLFGHACDIEWALESGHFWLLQARPITTAGRAERERVRREEIAALAEKAHPGGTVWSRYNLAEVLPEPTPMSWGIVRRLLSGRGGLGRMYRDLGIEPEPSLNDDCVYDLVCGRPYCNLSREPGMVANGLPLEHSFRALKAAPEKAIYPRLTPNPANAGWHFWFFLPALFVRSLRSQLRLRRLSAQTAGDLREVSFPAWNEAIDAEMAQDLGSVPPSELLRRWDDWLEFVLGAMARESLKPAVLAAFLLGNLEHGLVRSLGPERTRAALTRIIMGVSPAPEANLPKAIRDLSGGRLSEAEFLRQFGHRGDQEMELAQPRWFEDPPRLQRLGPAVSMQSDENSLANAWDAWNEIANEAKLTRTRRGVLEQQLQRLHTYLGLRETAKHYFMKGYALLRRYLVELDRRFQLNGGVFYLTPEELPRLVRGEDFTRPIAARRRRRSVALTIELPQVLFSDDLEAIGRPAPISGARMLQGIALSAGVADGPALVLQKPDVRDLPAQPYILVCPSTDPAWVPLFLQARGLVMETGGLLSHGAIVAREFGLPAVAGIPGVLDRIRNGQRLRVDGTSGTVALLPGE